MPTEKAAESRCLGCYIGIVEQLRVVKPVYPCIRGICASMCSTEVLTTWMSPPADLRACLNRDSRGVVSPIDVGPSR